ncbi:uncharacterized protein [Cicer arietinum]|uniref:uncharacterized protein n=1 Tax=Cicer arietinum TaxID=3827 RepID=UPI003CC5C84F
MYEGLEPDFEEMFDDLDPDFEEMYDDLVPNFNTMNDGIKPVMIDLTDVFTTDMMFDTRDDLLKWARNFECADNFAWTLQMVKEHITSGEVEVIVTDRDHTLMNAVEYVFPKAMNLLCLFHICKNVKAKCKMNVFPKMKQWLIPHKERFVEAWTNKVMHFGNTTTQRVESAHWSLKMILQDSIDDICSVWETINKMIALQHNEIIASFEKNIIQKVHRYSNRLYVNLCGVVSKNAIDHILVEYDRVKYVDDIHVWWCKLTFHVDASRKPSELSVKHEIDVIVNKFEELDLPGIISLKGKLREIAYLPTMSMCPHVVKVKTKGALKKRKSKVSKRDKSTKCDPSWWEYVDASVRCSGTNACSTITTGKVQKLAPRPSVQKLTHRPSVSTVQQPRVLIFKDWLPVEIHKFIDDIIDVSDDGNCGYRALAALLRMGENYWAFIRQQCVVELQEFMPHYERIFGGENFVRQLIHNVYVEQVATMDNWISPA